MTAIGGIAALGILRLRHVVATLLIAAEATGSNAWAQLPAGDRLPEALKEVRPATGVCRANESAGSALMASAVLEVAPDIGCAVTVAEAKSMLARPSGLLADLRSTLEYEQFHIEGAVPLTLSALSSKPYWREKDVVLVGSGKNERDLYKTCARLERAGYKRVRVLRGGMPEWLVSAQDVVGRAPTVQQLSRLSAAEFWLESQNTDNLVVLAKEQHALQGELTFSIKLTDQTAHAVNAVLERRHKELKGAPLSAVVLAAEPSINDDQIRRLGLALRPVPVLVFAGSHDDVLRHLSTQKAIWAAQTRGPKQPACGL